MTKSDQTSGTPIPTIPTYLYSRVPSRSIAPPMERIITTSIQPRSYTLLPRPQKRRRCQMDATNVAAAPCTRAQARWRNVGEGTTARGANSRQGKGRGWVSWRRGAQAFGDLGSGAVVDGVGGLGGVGAEISISFWLAQRRAYRGWRSFCGAAIVFWDMGVMLWCGGSVCSLVNDYGTIPSLSR